MWQAVRQELRGAWRSLRYDLGRPEPRPDQTDTDQPQFDRPQVGFDQPSFDQPSFDRPEFDQPCFDRPRRRLRAVATVAGVAVLVLGGVVGTYLAVVGGLGVLVSQPAPPADPLPAEEVSEQPSVPVTSGPGSITVPTQATAADGSAIPDPRLTGSPGAGVSGGPGVPTPKPAPSCNCVKPPAPTATSPISPPTDPSTTPPGSDPSPSPSPSATGEPSPGPSGDPSGG